MAKRHDDAWFIQLGAVNPSGTALSIADACREVREEGGNVREDVAIRAMVHQLAYICNTGGFDENYGSYMDEIAKHCLPSTVQVGKIVNE